MIQCSQLYQLQFQKNFYKRNMRQNIKIIIILKNNNNIMIKINFN